MARPRSAQREGVWDMSIQGWLSNIEFQIDQSHSTKLSSLPNAIGQFIIFQ